MKKQLIPKGFRQWLLDQERRARRESKRQARLHDTPSGDFDYEYGYAGNSDAWERGHYWAGVADGFSLVRAKLPNNK